MHRILLLTVFFPALLACRSDHSAAIRVLSAEELEAARIAFGKELFQDRRLSLDSSISCMSCHQPRLAFTDGKALSDGVGGRKSFRNAPTLLNVGSYSHFMFDAQIPSLEMQAIVPIQDSNEMALTMRALVARLRKDETYLKKARLFYRRGLNAWVVTRALADFERSLQSNYSRFDQYLEDPERYPLTTDEQQGWELFNAKHCVACHALPHFTNGEARSNGYGSMDPHDPGRYRVTGKGGDYGAFKVPSLRNIALTAPYMHNGNLGSLEEVLDFYASDKAHLRNTDTLVQELKLTAFEKARIIDFLQSLTDTSYLDQWR